MKKILALVLALLMIATMVSVTACSKDDDEPDDTDDENEYIDSSKGTEGQSESESATDTEAKDTEPEVTEPEETEWIKKDDYICVGVNGLVLREGPGKDYKNVASLESGTKLKRLETNGRWDKVSYEGATCYVSAIYTTTSVKDFTFVEYEEEDQVLLNVKEECTVNLRSTPFYTDGDATANVLFSGFGPTETDGEGESLKLIAKSESGVWYKVSFTGTWGSKTYENKICYLKNTSEISNVVDGLPSSGTSQGGPSFG